MKYFKIWDTLWYVVWMTAETLHINLGRFAPWIFAQMMGVSKYKRIS
jgi:hypothetical protein